VYLTSQVSTTSPSGYAELFEAARCAHDELRATFVLSSTHFTEVYNIESVDQRREIVTVMEELTDFHYLLGRPPIQELEVEAALSDVPGVTIQPQGPIALVGQSGLWAFGKRGGLRLDAPDPAAAAAAICSELGLDPGADALAALNRWAERSLLIGPDDHHDPELIAMGYTRANWHAILERRAQQERELANELDTNPHLRAGRLRDVINAREMSIELIDIVTTVTMAMGTTIGELLDYDREKLRNFSDGMPSSRVATSMKERYHKDSRREWTTNDIHDIDALAIAVPYCDAVFTDKAARNNVKQGKELAVFGTALPRTPAELTDWLENLTGSAAGQVPNDLPGRS
jgi:hypothetical protein